MPSGSSSKEPLYLLLGRVLRPHGVRGELRIEILTDYPERIVPGSSVQIGPDPDDPATIETYEVTGARRHQQYLILRLEGLDDRNAVEPLRDQFLLVPLADAVPLEAGEFYLFQVIGVEVYTEDGEHLGAVADVIETGANDVYVVRGPRGEILIPDVEEFVLTVDIEAGRMTVRLMEGLLGE
ncbi:MAG: 16S rRNA processing protein RimM [Chloroflexi bacterium]|nr:16S rRNA processing protein RimM [Chloroflexota bacterium]